MVKIQVKHNQWFYINILCIVYDQVAVKDSCYEVVMSPLSTDEDVTYADAADYCSSGNGSLISAEKIKEVILRRRVYYYHFKYQYWRLPPILELQWTQHYQVWTINGGWERKKEYVILLPELEIYWSKTVMEIAWKMMFLENPSASLVILFESIFSSNCLS